ncbi:hypothetical protein [Sanguibacter sp. 25GB23B1]|uniref:hypothetical protein n=1 Tax=unclassified Sanguibacter TaxID=2645534 RepID=UPI0032AF6AE5
MRRPLRAGALVLVASTIATAGCTVFGEAGTCISWAPFATPGEALDNAELTVTARILDRDGTAHLYDTDAHVWTMTTDGLAPLRGEAPSETVRVISTPVTCEDGGPYPDGDPLDTDDTLVLFLTRDQAGDDWRTLTPRQGTVPAGPAGELPQEWPHGLDRQAR